MKILVRLLSAFVLVPMVVSAASAQTSTSTTGVQSSVLASGLARAFAAGTTSDTAQAGSSAPDAGWNIAIYPIYAWIPLGIDLDVTVPPGDGGEGGGSGEIIDGRFDGAYFGGLSAAKGRFRIDATGLWAAVGGDRPSLPFLRVDADVIYFHTTGGVRLVKDLYATGGVRRLAMKYNIQLANLPEFERKPGVWDPLVGLAWHTEGRRLVDFHATFETGGFGVGTEIETAASVRVDFKPLKHFGITAGYSFLYFRLEDTVRNRTFEVKQTLHGPLAGIGIYF